MQWYTIWVPGWHNAYACCRFGHVPGCAIEGALLTAVAAMFSFFLSQLWKGGICVVVQFMEGTRWRGQDEFVVAGGRWMAVHCFSRWGLCRGAGGVEEAVLKKVKLYLLSGYLEMSGLKFPHQLLFLNKKLPSNL